MFTNKKIMVLCTTDNMIWQFLLPHIKHMQENGNIVECVCSKTGFWFDELKNQYGLVMHEINFARKPLKFSNLKAYKKLKQLQITNKYDLIYCQQPVGGMMGRLLAKKFNIPCIYTAHGFHFYKGCSIVNKLLYKPVEKWSSKHTDILITINEEDYQNALKMKAKKVFKINGIGIDTNKTSIPIFDKEEFRKSLGLHTGDKVVTTVSELNKNKNYITMLRAVKNLAKKDDSVKFISCGHGVWEKKIKRYAEKLGIADKCLFLGYRKDIGKILAITDVFLHASYREGLTLSVMEAMSFGLPCVVSNVRGNRDLIVNGKGGFVIDPDDAEGFADKLNEILTNKELASQFSEFNKEQSKRYVIESVKEQLDKIYDKV